MHRKSFNQEDFFKRRDRKTKAFSVSFSNPGIKHKHLMGCANILTQRCSVTSNINDSDRQHDKRCSQLKSESWLSG